MPYYPQFNLIFVHIPKTAGGAIEELLLPYKAPGMKTPFRRVAAKMAMRQDMLKAYIPGHSTAQWHHRVMGRNFFNTRRFAVVRDPYSRLISSYEFIRQNPNHHSHGIIKRMSFTEFLKYRPMSQMPFLLNSSGVRLVDHIVRFENLDFELAALFSKLQIPLKLPAGGKRNSSKKMDTEDYLSPEAITLINNACAEDFRRLCYPMHCYQNSNNLR